ncbi:MAG: nitrate/sulfonate/bicarbonate ABC transporter ATP-binding protein [Candidatus Nanopelagicales bacterium]
MTDTTSTQAAPAPLMTLQDIRKSFATTDGEHLVLDGIDLTIEPGEVLALLGKSGSGKSTLLRCIAGLMAPSSGEVLIGDRQLDGPNSQTAMVFQTFALLPWLTVQQNVELGLEARGIESKERTQKAQRAIELIGLDGFEDAFPKELSGGMRQRVGFARALVVEPDVLLMDEPFSALDVLTAETLRNELIELIANHEFTISSVVIVTHNIEEAVVLADRVAVLGSDPGRIKALFDIEMPQPRDRDSAQFVGYVDQIYDLLTQRNHPDVGGGDSGKEQAGPDADAGGDQSASLTALPLASVDGISGLADILAREGTRTIANLADDLGLEVDDLLPQVEALEQLGFAEVHGGRVGLTDIGTDFAGGSIRREKLMFAEAARGQVPLVATIVRALERSKSKRIGAGFFRDALKRRYNDSYAQAQLDVAVDWGRYSELYTFDADRDEFTLEEPHDH